MRKKVIDWTKNYLLKRARIAYIIALAFVTLLLIPALAGSSVWSTAQGKHFADSDPTAWYTDQGNYFEDSNAYVVFVRGVNCSTGVGTVLFPTWTDANGQDDIKWSVGNNLGNGIWSYRVFRSDHNNELGTYITDVWVQDNSGQMVNLHVRFYIDCENYNASLSDNIPRTMEAGKTYSVSVTGTNFGYNTWTPANNYRLGGGIFTGETRYLMDNSATVALNQSYTFTFNVTAPTTPGSYSGWFEMLQELVTWFGQRDNITVNVVDTTPPTQPSISVSGNSTSATVQISGSTDSGSGLENYQYDLDNQGWISYPGSVTVSDPGQHTIQAKAEDKSGNVSTVVTTAFRVNFVTDDTRGSATEVTQGNSVNQTIDNPSDEKYYKIKPAAGKDYLEAIIVDPVVNGKSLNYTVSLYDASGYFLDSIISKNGTDYLRCKANSDGYYYVKVNGDADNYSASIPFTLTVN